MTMKKYLDLFEAAPMPTGSTALPATTPSVTAKPATRPVRPGDASAYVGGPVDATAQVPDTSKGIPNTQSKMVNNPMQDFEESMEETVEEELAEMMRLSGLALNEKAPPGAKAERMVKHVKKGYAKDGKLTKKEKSIAYATAWKQHNKEKVTEDVMLDEGGSTLNHIANRFKYEVKMFMQAGVMDNDLYEALSDYYIDRGEVPYGVAKGKPGYPDMTQWVEERFYANMGSDMSESAHMYEVVDDSLNELAKLAGLEEDGAGQFGMPNSQSMSATPPKAVIDKSVNPVAQFAADLEMPPLPFFSKKEKADYESMKARKAERQFQQSGSAYRDDAGVRYNSRGEPAEYLGLRSKDYFDPKPNRDRDLYNMQHDPAFKNIQKEDGPGAALLYSKDKSDSFGDKLKSAGKSVRQTIDKATLPSAMRGDYDRIEAEKDKRDADAAATKSMPLGEQSDDSLNRMRRIAGLKECSDDMDMEQSDSFNVSTNMSSDGTKELTINAQGDRADELLQMLKMAGMRPHDDHSVSMSEPEIIMIGGNDEMMEQELEEAKKRKTRYSNTPDEEYQSVKSITDQGNDLNRQKRQYAGKPRLGDNPMAESTLDADLDAMLESVLIRDDKDEAEIKKDTKTGRVSATFPPPKKPDQSELPLPSEQESRVSGPRSLKVGGEPTGTEREVDEEIDDLDEQGSNTPNPYPVGQDALTPQQKLNPTNNPNKSIVRGIKDFIMNPLKPGM